MTLTNMGHESWQQQTEFAQDVEQQTEEACNENTDRKTEGR